MTLNILFALDKAISCCRNESQKQVFFALAAQKIWASYFMPAWSQTDLE